MTHMNRTSKPNLVLTEILIVTVFFALSSAVILKVFTASYQRAQVSREKTRALTIAQDVLERLSASMQAPDEYLLEQGWVRGSEAGSFERPPDELGYLALASVGSSQQPGGALYQVELTVWRKTAGSDDAHSVLSLTTALYLPGGGVAG
jgi:type II secretory pathway pseudopilin PulG